MSKAVLFVVLVLGVLGQAMHIHPHLGQTHEDQSNVPDDVPLVDTEKVQMDARNINSMGFVPLNNAFFFKLSSPCENGYQRDFLGICREVW